jgi:hypothetical protein
MTDKMALERVLALVKATEEGVPPTAWSWWEQQEATLWVLEGLLERAENDE